VRAPHLQGSGKTLAFGLPILNFLVAEARDVAATTAAADANADVDANVDAHAVQSSQKGKLSKQRSKLRALVLCPTRELAMQVAAHMTAIAKPLGVRVVSIVGGVSAQKQERLLSYRPPVLVATPGRLWDVMRRGGPHVSDLTGLAFLVLDEADRMVKQGHYEELTHILGSIPAVAAGRGRARADAASGAGTQPDDDFAADADTDVMNTAAGSHTVEADAAEEADSLRTADAAKEGVKRAEPDGCVVNAANLPAKDSTIAHAVLDGPLRTYVFSATLTLSDALKGRLARGRGGSRGSGAGATFESLMERLTFRGRPKVRLCSFVACCISCV
jgi:superfamily II DNA/RNA helicase